MFTAVLFVTFCCYICPLQGTGGWYYATLLQQPGYLSVKALFGLKADRPSTSFRVCSILVAIVSSDTMVLLYRKMWDPNITCGVAVRFSICQRFTVRSAGSGRTFVVFHTAPARSDPLTALLWEQFRENNSFSAWQQIVEYSCAKGIHILHAGCFWKRCFHWGSAECHDFGWAYYLTVLHCRLLRWANG